MVRLLGSSKFWVAFATAVGAVLAAWGLPADRATAAVAAITAVGTAVVLAIGYEDGQRKGNESAPQNPPK